MGGPVYLYFLNTIVTQTWKDTYLHAYVAVAAAWDGGVSALDAVISANAPGILQFLPSALLKTGRDVVRSFQSVFRMLPSSLVFGNDTVFVQVGSDKYTTNDFEAFFQ